MRNHASNALHASVLTVSGAIGIVLTLMVLLMGLLFSQEPAAAAPPPTTMNFQGRLANSSNILVADGLYNMQFRIFTASSGGSAVWTETRETTNRVQVTNGLFSVQLGSVTPLSASVFNATDLYFEITMATPATATCSTASCASWESPMTPRNKLATSAYAFNAATLNGFDETDFAAASGSNSYIQNTTTPQTANFSITGTGTANIFRATTFDRATAGVLTVGGTNATSITLADNTSVTGTISATNLSGTNTGDISVSGQNYLTLVGQAITANAINLASNVTGTLPIANGGTGATTSQAAINALSQLTTNGDLLYYNGTNSTRLARGTNGQCLTSNATTVQWGSCGLSAESDTLASVTGRGATTATAVTFSGGLSATGSGTGLTVTNNATIGGTLAVTGTISGSNLSGTNTGNVTLSGENYLSIAGQTITANDINLGTNVTSTLGVANGGTGSTTAQGAINAISGLTTNGDLLYHNGTNSVRLARGSNGQCLTSNATTLQWGSCGLTSESDTLADVTGRGATTSTAVALQGGATIRGLTVETAISTQDQIILSAAATGAARFAGTITNADLTAARTYTLPNASGTFAVSASGNIALSAAGDITFTGSLTDAQVSNTLTASNFVGTGSTTNAVDLGTAEVAGTLGVANGGTGSTSAQGAINNISGLTTNGDLLYHNGTNSTRLARGSNGQCLTSTTTSLQWGSCGITSEADTLASVTGRGATTSTSLTMQGGAAIRGLTVDVAAAANVGIQVQGLSGQTGDLFQAKNNSGTNQMRVLPNGTVAIGNGSEAVTNNIGGSGRLLQIGSSAGLHVQLNENNMGFNRDAASYITNVNAGSSAALTLGVGSSSAYAISITSTNAVTMANTLSVAGTITGSNLSGTNTGNVSLSGQNYLSIAGQTITAGAINLSGTHVTATLGLGNGGTGSTSAQGAINNISGLTTNGDLLYHNGTNSIRLARGTDGQCLTSTTTSLQWGSCGSGANTSLSNLASTNINAALNRTSGDLTLQTTTSGNIVLNPVGTIQLQKATTVTGDLSASGNVFVGTGGGGLQLNSAGYIAHAAYSYTLIGGTVHNVSLGSTGYYRLTGSLPQTFTGFSNGSDGRLFTIMNASTAAITLANQNTGSALINRIMTGTNADLVVPSQSSVTMVYDSTSSRWRVTYTGNGVLLGDSNTWTGSNTFNNPVYSSTFDRATAGNLSIGNANATSVSLGGGNPTSISIGNNSSATEVIGGHSSNLPVLRATSWRSTAPVFRVSGASPQTADLIQATDAGLTNLFRVTANGSVALGNGSETVTNPFGGNPQMIQIGSSAGLHLQMAENNIGFNRDGQSYLVNRSTGSSAGITIGVGGISAFGLRVNNNNETIVNSSDDVGGYPSGYTRTLTVGGTAGGGSCGSAGCPVIAINSGGANGNRWGIGVPTNGGLAFATENGSSATTRMFLSNTANLTVAGTSACTIGSGTGNTSCTSDSRLKNLQGNATGNLQKILQLQPEYYTWKSDGTNTKRMGLIAQDVQQVLPEFVVRGKDGYLQLDYGGLVAPLIGAVGEQQAQINALSRRVNNLQNANWQAGGTINGNLTIGGSLNVMGNASFVNVKIAQNLEVRGKVLILGATETRDITIAGHVTSKGAKPTIVAEDSLGLAAEVSVSGTDGAGTVSLTSGTEGLAEGELARVKFAESYASNPRVVLSAINGSAAELTVYVTRTKDGFAIMSRDLLEPGVTYTFDYIVQAASN